MTYKKALINLKNFSSPEFKAEFQTNLSLQLGFLNICSQHIEYAFEILNDEPLKALEILHTLNDFHDTLGTMPNEILDLSVAIVSQIGNFDMERAIKMLDTIEVESYTIDAAIELLKKTDSKDYINEITIKIRILDDERVHEFEQELELVDI